MREEEGFIWLTDLRTQSSMVGKTVLGDGSLWCDIWRDREAGRGMQEPKLNPSGSHITAVAPKVTHLKGSTDDPPNRNNNWE